MHSFRIGVCLGILSVFLFVAGAFAQTGSSSYAEYLPVTGDSVSDGSIVSLSSDGYQLASEAYDQQTYGVVDLSPAVAVSIVAGDNKVPVVSTGTVPVNVSSAGGPIGAGDFIRTSDVPGVGMLAGDPGVVLGTALESFEGTSPDEVGQIPVALNIHFAVAAADASVSDRFIDQVRQAIVTGAVAATTDPNTALRYIVAAVVMILSLLFALFVFGRSATGGIAAIGRNPLARRSIILAVSFNVLMGVAVVVGGAVAAFFILAL